MIFFFFLFVFLFNISSQPPEPIGLEKREEEKEGGGGGEIKGYEGGLDTVLRTVEAIKAYYYNSRFVSSFVCYPLPRSRLLGHRVYKENDKR